MWHFSGTTGEKEAGPAFSLDSSQMHSSLPSWVGGGESPEGTSPPCPLPTFIQNSACTLEVSRRCRMSRKIPLVKPLQAVQPQAQRVLRQVVGSARHTKRGPSWKFPELPPLCLVILHRAFLANYFFSICHSCAPLPRRLFSWNREGES